MAYHNHHLSQDLPLHHFTHQSHHQQHHNQPHTDNSLRPILSDHLASATHTSPDPTTKPGSDPHHPLQTAPNWLNNALLRTQYSDNNNSNNTNVNGANNNNGTDFLNLHTAASDSTGPTSQSSGQWLGRPILHRNHSDDVAAGDSIIAGGTLSHESADLKPTGDNVNNKTEAVVVDSGDGLVSWQNARYKAEILAHPLYEQLLSAHVACLRIATPVDQLPRIDAQLAQSQNVVSKYSAFGHGTQSMVGDDKELDQFLGL